MRYVKLFPSDTRSSLEKMKMVQENKDRVPTMLGSEDFQKYGESYWDKKEIKVGYGGYHYDGRYKNTVKKMVDFYGLKPGDRVLEFGCGKGFVLTEFHYLGMSVVGVEMSQYAYENAHPDIKQHLLNMDLMDTDLPKGSFDLVIAKDCLPHVPIAKLKPIMEKLISLSNKNCLFEIEVTRNPFESDMLYQWDITHVTRQSPQWWIDLLQSINYQGDYHFKVLIEDPQLGDIDEWLKKNHP